MNNHFVRRFSRSFRDLRSSKTRVQNSWVPDLDEALGLWNDEGLDNAIVLKEVIQIDSNDLNLFPHFEERLDY